MRVSLAVCFLTVAVAQPAGQTADEAAFNALNAAEDAGKSPDEVGHAVAEAASLAGGSTVYVAKLAGEAAGHAAADSNKSPQEVGEAAADAAFAAGGSTADVAMLAGKAAAEAAEDSAESFKEVGKASVDAIVAAGGSEVDVVKLAQEAAREAARGAGKTHSEVGRTAGQAVIAAAQALAKKRRGQFLAAHQRGSGEHHADDKGKADDGEAVIVIHKAHMEAANAAPVEVGKDWSGIKFVAKEVVAVCLLITIAIAASAIAARISSYWKIYCGVSKCISYVGTLHTKTVCGTSTSNSCIGAVGKIQETMVELTSSDDSVFLAAVEGIQEKMV